MRNAPDVLGFRHDIEATKYGGHWRQCMRAEEPSDAPSLLLLLYDAAAHVSAVHIFRLPIPAVATGIDYSVRHLALCELNLSRYE